MHLTCNLFQGRRVYHCDGGSPPGVPTLLAMFLPSTLRGRGQAVRLPGRLAFPGPGRGWVARPFRFPPASRDWRLATGDWRLATRDWRLASTQNPAHRGVHLRHLR